MRYNAAIGNFYEERPVNTATEFMQTVISPENIVFPATLAQRLKTTKAELAAALGVPRDSVSKTAKARERDTQHRLRDMAEIIDHAIPLAGSESAAFAWYRSQPLPSFGGRTPEALAKEGRAEAVKTYLSRIAAGGYA